MPGPIQIPGSKDLPYPQQYQYQTYPDSKTKEIQAKEAELEKLEKGAVAKIKTGHENYVPKTEGAKEIVRELKALYKTENEIANKQTFGRQEADPSVLDAKIAPSNVLDAKIAPSSVLNAKPVDSKTTINY